MRERNGEECVSVCFLNFYVAGRGQDTVNREDRIHAFLDLTAWRAKQA